MPLNRSIIVFLTVLFAGSLCLSACAGRDVPVTAQAQKAETSTPVNKQENSSATPKSAPSTEIVRRPEIVSREQWGAKAPVGEAKEHTIRFITVHHTASPQKKGVSIEKKMQALQNFSQTAGRLGTGKLKPVWFDIPYHFYISADGKIAEGRSIKFVGDTNTEYDPTGHALVVLEGNFENEEPSAEQLKSLQEVAAWLAAVYKVPVSDIKAHNDYASTACPGKKLKILLPSLRNKIAESFDTKKE